MFRVAVAATLAVAFALAEKPPDLPCVTWEPLTAYEPTPSISSLFVASYNWLVANEITLQCIQKGYIIPCFASDTGINSWGHHDYVPGFSSSDYCRTWHEGSVYYSNNMYVPKKGPKYKTWKWKLTQSGGKVPDNAIRMGESVMAKSVVNPPDRCMGKGFTGWAVGKKDGTFGAVHFSVFKDPFTTSTFQVAICKAYHPTPAPTLAPTPGPTAAPTPVPSLPPGRPYIRFGNTIPSDHKVTATISQGNMSKTWENYGFGHFSAWTEIFSPGHGEIEVWESVGGNAKSKLLIKKQIPLTPGPLTVVTKGMWPLNETTNIETIACSYVPTIGDSGVRIFNLSPDTQNIGLRAGTSLLAEDIAYTTGSVWSPIPVVNQEFTVFDDKGNSTLGDVDTEPPEPPLSFTIFLIGLSNVTAGSPYKTRAIPLIDAPEA